MGTSTRPATTAQIRRCQAVRGIVCTGLLIFIGLSAWTGLAWADTDTSFLQQVRRIPTFASGADNDLITAGHGVCQVLNNGGTVNDIVAASPLPAEDVKAFGGAAIVAYCPEKLFAPGTAAQPQGGDQGGGRPAQFPDPGPLTSPPRLTISQTLGRFLPDLAKAASPQQPPPATQTAPGQQSPPTPPQRKSNKPSPDPSTSPSPSSSGTNHPKRG